MLKSPIIRFSHTHVHCQLKSMGLILLLMLATITTAFAEITVRVDRNPVNANESFQLIFAADASPDDDPDFSVLESDFEILNQSQSSNISMVNGSFSKSLTWTLTVMAKQAGIVQIPAVPFGDDHSQAVRLRVNNGSQTPSSTSQNEDIFIQVSANQESAFVQSQIIYTLRVYRKVNISQANLTEPEPADALIEQLGEDSNFNTEHNGVSYVVTERKYAIFPQKSGLLTIDPVVLTAEVVMNNSRPRGFFNRSSTRTRRIVSEPLVIEIKAAPKDINTAHWLPATHVYLEQKWSGELDNLQPGEPITRTLSLIAKGTTVGQLPELNNSNVVTVSKSGGELKSYPDQPLLKEQKKSDGIIAFREEKTAIIPSKSGVYHLPVIEIPWWNTQTQTLEHARIPATTLTAVGAMGTQVTTPSTPDPSVENITTEIPSNAPSTVNNIWFWLAIFFGLAWLVTLGLWYANRNKHSTVEIKPSKTNTFDTKALKKACREHQPTTAKDELVKWGRQQWQLSNLTTIASQCEPALQAEILALNKLLYSQQTDQWQGEKLLLAFKKNTLKTAHPKDNPNQVLQPLFKA